MELNKSVSFISQRFDEYKRDLREKDAIISVLQNNVNVMSESIDSLYTPIDRQEQHSRRNCLLIHNIPVEKDEITEELVIDTVAENMGETITLEDLDCTHRIGTPN